MCDRSRLSAENALQQTAERLHALGALPLFHFLTEILAGRDITETLSRYTALDPEVVRMLGRSMPVAGPTICAFLCAAACWSRF